MKPHDHKAIARAIDTNADIATPLIIQPFKKVENIVAEITAIGDKVDAVKVGDRIIFAKGSFKEIENGLYSITMDGDKLFIYG